MPTPTRPLPERIDRWTSMVRLLRWVDALVAWAAACAVLALVWPDALGAAQIVAALVAVGVAALLPPLRVRWRPVSGPVGLATSRALRPGDRAWYVRSGAADLVLVTARHGLRLVVVTSEPDAAEGLTIRRTRVVLLPVD